MKKWRCKYYNKGITTRDNGNVQNHDQEESKLNSAIIAISGAHTVTDSFNKNIAAAVKSKLNSNKDFITRASQIGTLVPIHGAHS